MSTSVIASFSGGKDSTAMLHILLEHGHDVTVVAFDTGWEWPQVYEHWDLVEHKTGLEITRLHPRMAFDYLLSEKPVKGREATGWGWPSMMQRWCTGRKVRELDAWHKDHAPEAASAVGYAHDEQHRQDRAIWVTKPWPVRFPLIDAEMAEADALAYCYRLGYDWGGLYDHFPRVSCFCCPLQSLGELRNVRRHYPEQWARMLTMDDAAPHLGKGFREGKTLRDLDERFKQEDRQMELVLTTTGGEV